MNEKLWGILMAMCLSLAGFCLKQTFDANARMTQLNEQIIAFKENSELKFDRLEGAIKALANDKETDMKQDRTLSMHWTLHTWAREQIHRLEFEAGRVPSPWPPLDK